LLAILFEQEPWISRKIQSIDYKKPQAGKRCSRAGYFSVQESLWNQKRLDSASMGRQCQRTAPVEHFLIDSGSRGGVAAHAWQSTYGNVDISHVNDAMSAVRRTNIQISEQLAAKLSIRVVRFKIL